MRMTDVSDRPHKSRTPPSRDTPVVRSVALSLAGQVLVTRQIVGGDVSRLISNRPVQARDETIIRFREIMASRSPNRELRGKRALLRQTRPLDFRSGTDSEEHSSGAVSRRPPTQKVRINATRLFVNFLRFPPRPQRLPHHPGREPGVQRRLRTLRNPRRREGSATPPAEGRVEVRRSELDVRLDLL